VHYKKGGWGRIPGGGHEGERPRFEKKERERKKNGRIVIHRRVSPVDTILYYNGVSDVGTLLSIHVARGLGLGVISGAVCLVSDVEIVCAGCICDKCFAKG
jgi:hypothetical protein